MAWYSNFLRVFSLKKWAIIRIVYGCNHECGFCHERDNIFSFDFRSIQLSDLEGIYLWIMEHWFDYVIISGWEPSLHPDFVSIIEFFQQRDIYVVVVNNGTWLDKHNYDWVDKNKITWYISYHWLEESYNQITGSNDWSKVTDNIARMSEIFDEVILRCVVNSINITTIPTYREFIKTRLPWVYSEFVLLEDFRFAHIQKVAVPIWDFYKAVLPFINDSHVLLDGGQACIHPRLFQMARYKFDPLVNTMIWLVKKKKTWEILYDIKKHTSNENIKSYWNKCKTCIQYDVCHGCDVFYFQNKDITNVSSN